MARFVKKGDVVFVKPNIGWDRKPEQAGNTNPQVVAAIVKHVLDAGAKTVKVGDNTVNAAARTYETSGIAAAVKAAGAEVVFFDKARYKQVDIGGERIKTLLLYPDDHRKRPGDQRPHRQAPRPLQRHDVHEELHGRDGQSGPVPPGLRRLPDRPDALHEAAAVRLGCRAGLERPRPQGGKLEDVAVKTTVAAGVDIVALDALGLELLGKEPGQVKKAARSSSTPKRPAWARPTTVRWP